MLLVTAQRVVALLVVSLRMGGCKGACVHFRLCIACSKLSLGSLCSCTNTLGESAIARLLQMAVPLESACMKVQGAV